MQSAAPGLTLEDITSGKYYGERILGVTPWSDGESFTRISPDGQRITRRSFRNNAELGDVVNLSATRGAKIRNIDGYTVSPDGQHILLQTNTKAIYRRSFTADYYIYSVRNKTLEPLSQNGAQRAPVFSPDGTMIAFVRDNNLFLVKLLFDNSESQVTRDGKDRSIINGVPDWVNEEEFSTNRSYCFTSDSKMLVWVRYDESEVKEFSFPIYRGLSPQHEEAEAYPSVYRYKYPVAGERNATVTLHSFDIKSHAVRKIDLPLPKDGYIPRIFPLEGEGKVAVVTLNRHQDVMDIYSADPRSTLCRLVLREKSDNYVREAAYCQLAFYGNQFVLTSDRSGYNQLYLYDLNGRMVRRLTQGNYEVTQFYGFSPESGKTYYACREEGPLYQNVCSTDSKGRIRRLTTQKGDNSAIFSSSFKYFMNVHSSLTTPPVTTLRDESGKMLCTLIDNHEIKAQLAERDKSVKEFFSFTTSEGVQLNGWMVRPEKMTDGKKYPVVMYQYSGPGSQEVLDQWGTGFMGGGAVWEAFLAQEGFISVCVDGRGTGGRGSAFEKQTYLHLGLLESRDQVEAALYLATLPYVDKDRIAIWGWSFGGFNTLMSMSEGRKVFRSGVAVAAPSNWKYYDTVYTERYMRTPEENSEGYAVNPIGRVPQFSGDLLLMHGTADDNVHYRNAAEFSEAMVQAGKQFDMQVFTNRNHSIFGGGTRRYLCTRMLRFWERTLGENAARQ